MKRACNVYIRTWVWKGEALAVKDLILSPPLPALHSLSPSGRVLAKFLVLSYNEKKTARRNDKILYLTKEEDS